MLTRIHRHLSIRLKEIEAAEEFSTHDWFSILDVIKLVSDREL